MSVLGVRYRTGLYLRTSYSLQSSHNLPNASLVTQVKKKNGFQVPVKLATDPKAGKWFISNSNPGLLNAKVHVLGQGWGTASPRAV